jgi:hypothetical protein
MMNQTFFPFLGAQIRIKYTNVTLRGRLIRTYFISADEKSTIG